MAKWCVLLLAASSLHAAIVQGMIVEKQTGKPLAHAQVTLQPVAGTAAGAQSVRTSVYGTFEFAPTRGGAYLVTASHLGFATVRYGQKHLKAEGVPIILEEAASTTLRIALPRMGAISGTILDENDVGLPEHDVVVYRNARPLQIAARGRTDDRGMFRIWGLEPGKYLVRTVGKQYEEGGYLPTFHKETPLVEQALTVDVDLDRDSSDVNVRPFMGRLFRVSGKVNPGAPNVTVTLVSDVGEEKTSTDKTGRFQFNPTAPGEYELFAESAADRFSLQSAAYQALSVERDLTDVSVMLRGLPEFVLTFEDQAHNAVDGRALTVLARRTTLAGEGKPEVLRTGGAVALPPGRWEFALEPNASFYPTSFTGPMAQGALGARADGWNETLLLARASVPFPIRFTLSSAPGAIHGVVTGEGHQPSPGAPVYLEPYDLEQRKRLSDVRATRTDTRGQYHFYGLAPGNYRLLSTFEFRVPDAEMIDSAHPVEARVEERQDLSRDLDLYILP
jgi:hypothetical protein